MRRLCLGVALVAGTIGVGACRETPLVRNGPAQQKIVARTYAHTTDELRSALLQRYPQIEPGARDSLSADLFHVLSISEQPPPGFTPDWLATYVDPSGYLEPYRGLTPAERTRDLVLAEWTGDRYWRSEYDVNGQAVPFRCGIVVHFVERTPESTEVQVFEIVPTVWAGEHWEWAKEGIGFGRYHDIRFVEPTVNDREAVLQFIDSILK